MNNSPSTPVILAPSGTVQMDQGRMLLHAAEAYGSDHEALGGQKGENARDAGATQIVFEIDLPNDRVIITDNGSGMNGPMKAGDRQIGDAWMQGQRDEDWEMVVQRMSLSSRQSLQAMMRYVARSRKVQDGTQRGQKGIGALSHLQVADECTIYTIPNPEIQADAGDKLNAGECWVLQPPTRAQLEKNDLGYPPIAKRQRTIRAPGLGQITHGTQLVISQLHEGVARSLNPKELAAFLGSRFGGDIAEERVEIIVYDRTTPEGRKVQGGIPIKARAPEYKGNCIFDEVLQTTHGKERFRVQLFYSAHHRGVRSPMLCRQGDRLHPLNQLPEKLFSGFPWTALEGVVEIPGKMPLAMNKSTPLQSSRAYLHWIKRLRELGDELEEKIGVIEKKVRSRSTARLGTEMAVATLTAMSQVEIFKDQPLGILLKKKKKKTQRKTKAVLKVRRDTEVTVLDENDEPVAGNAIQLLHGERLITTKTTGKGGYVSFGRQPVKVGYRFVLAKTAAGCVVAGAAEHPFDLDLENPGYRYVFHVKTGRKPKGETRKLDRRFQVWIHPFEDADPDREIFRGRLPSAIDVNEANRYIDAALDRPDFQAIDALVAYGIATLVAQWSLPGRDIEFILNAAGQLFAATRDTLEEMHRGKKRKRA